MGASIDCQVAHPPIISNNGIIMPVCSRCQGQGKESYDEDNRLVTDVCWHCSGSGQVEPEVDLQDRLLRVAHTLASQAETEYRKACDNDPEGEGYEFCAAENMLSAHDYFQERVSDRKFKLFDQISQLDSSIQNALLEWNEAPKSIPSPNGASAPVVDASVTAQFNKDIQSDIKGERIFEMQSIFGADDIPF